MNVTIPVELIINTIVTGIIGWCVTAILNNLKAYRKESSVWRKQMDEKVDVINSATQATMRTTILHYCEKYLTRNWVTSEELASLNDMHQKYTKLVENNGFINGYMERVNRLEVKEI